jgi:N-acyl-D-amino-acid deacylase
MNRTLSLLAGAVVVSGLFLAPGAAQFPTRPPTNPYVGTPGTNPNPLVGQPHAGYNPLTGKLGHTDQVPHAKIPVSGKSVPGLDALDRAVLKIMDHHGIPAAGLAIARNGKLIYARGFGWSNIATAAETGPQTFFCLASLSKPFTAVAILQLAEQGKLNLDDPAMKYLAHIKPPRGARVDPRLGKATIRQLLNHTGGWDRNVSGDPVTWSPQIARAMRIRLPVSPRQFISFMQAVPLNFGPGSKFVYSNVGYIFLGEIVEKVSGQHFEEYIQKNVLRPAGIEKAFLSTMRTHYHPNEAHCYLAGTTTEIPPMTLPLANAAAGWVASPVDMVRFLTAIDGSRGKRLISEKSFRLMVAEPPPPVKKNDKGIWPGLGWPTVGASGKSFGYMHDGNWPGTRTFMKHNAANGTNSALMFNASAHPDPTDQGTVMSALREVKDELDRLGKVADMDLFPTFR